MFTDQLEKKINDLILGGVSFTPPGVYYAALATSTVGEDGTFTEANYTGYGRVSLANNKTNFSNAADDGDATVNNAVEIRFPTLEGGTCTPTALVLMDALTGGTAWVVFPISTQKNYVQGDRPVFEVNKLTHKIVAIS